ncbi:MAG: response regulator [Gallintestinimicrobium sp.]|uniref:response regulator n=1 Tax=Gallintestinimicrobium sp. TaxID=2981655 RepID=UPI003990E2A6
MQGNTQMINIAICDDDVAMTATIEKMLYVIAKEQNIKISSAVFFDGSTLVANIRQGVCYDLIYLDIEMHNVNGINAAELIRNMEIPALIIYVSSYEKISERAVQYRTFPISFKTDNTGRFSGGIHGSI